jgi:hypothetical protein
MKSRVDFKASSLVLRGVLVERGSRRCHDDVAAGSEEQEGEQHHDWSDWLLYSRLKGFPRWV